MVRAVSAAALGLAALSASPALALPPDKVVAHVPFAFSVAGETLPAGDYRINRLDSLDPQVLEVRSTDGRYAALAFTIDSRPGARATQPELIFDKYGKKEFLHAVRLSGETGAVLEPSRSEIQAARDLTASKMERGTATKMALASGSK